MYRSSVQVGPSPLQVLATENFICSFPSPLFPVASWVPIWALAAKRPYKWNLVLNLFSTELPFTRGSFTASVRDHNLREASHLCYEGKE